MKNAVSMMQLLDRRLIGKVIYRRNDSKHLRQSLKNVANIFFIKQMRKKSTTITQI